MIADQRAVKDSLKPRLDMTTQDIRESNPVNPRIEYLSRRGRIRIIIIVEIPQSVNQHITVRRDRSKDGYTVRDSFSLSKNDSDFTMTNQRIPTTIQR